MAFQVSPGINVQETDLTTIVPTINTTSAGICNFFQWGPADQRVVIDSEDNLLALFGKPIDASVSTIANRTWFEAANFLAYGNNLQVVRAVGATAYNASTRSVALAGGLSQSAGTGTGATPTTVKNSELWSNAYVNPTYGDPAVDAEAGEFIAKYPGTLGNGLAVHMCDCTDIALELTIPAGVNIWVGGTGGTLRTAATAWTPGDIVYRLTDTTISPTVNPLTIGTVPALSGDIIAIGRVHSWTPYVPSQALTGNNNYTGGGVLVIKNILSGFTPATRQVNNANDAAKFLHNTNYASLTMTIGLSYTFAGTAASGEVLAAPISATTTLATANPTHTATWIDDIKAKTTIVARAISQFSLWKFANLFSQVPGTSSWGSTIQAVNDEIHVVVQDVSGNISGTAGTILETYAGVSKAANALNSDGSTNYYVTVINNDSAYVWVNAHPQVGAPNSPAETVIDTNSSTLVWGATLAQTAGSPPFYFTRMSNVGAANLGVGDWFNNGGLASTSNIVGAASFVFTSGADGTTNLDTITTAYDAFANPEESDIRLLIAPAFDDSGVQTVSCASKVLQIATDRKDCTAHLTIPFSVASGPKTGVSAASVAFRNLLTSTSYGFLDTGWKYQYDKYTNVYKWIPACGDTAGLCVRTDTITDPWFSPAGFNRGQIKNVVKLLWNPTKTDRDVIYQNGINPVSTFPGEGTVLFGDRTLQSKPSSFDRINVRRLFIVLEKSLAIAAKYSLFELNDAFTQAQFRSLVEPFLRDIQGRRGIESYAVRCDSSNNTDAVKNRNEFVAEIRVKPIRSINFITLKFVATNNTASFEEIG